MTKESMKVAYSASLIAGIPMTSIHPDILVVCWRNDELLSKYGARWLILETQHHVATVKILESV